MATTNRTVSFVSHLELDLDDSKVLPHALSFGDVDNDGGDELVVGTTAGFLYVFRGHSYSPWCKLEDHGQIVCVTIGDVLNTGQNQAVVLNMEGICFVYSFPSKGLEPGAGPIEIVGEKDISQKAELLHKQLLQTNTKMMLLGDVDCDGVNELLLCHTDRTVSACRWNKSSEVFDTLQEWKLHQSVGGITLHGKNESGWPQVIASQPGCSYAVLRPLWTSKVDGESVTSDTVPGITYNPMSSLSRSQNPAISCNIVGDICKGPDCQKGYFALCTLDGTIKLIEDDHVLWSIQVGHRLFAMNKLDVLANGKEEVIVCAWNGVTYIVDHDRNVVRFPYDGNVQAFCAGQYAIEDGENVVSLVYANFRNKLYLYYDIQLPQLRMPDFLTEAESHKDFSSLLSDLGAQTDKEKRSLIRYCMYGLPYGSDDEVLSGEKIELFKRKSNDV